MWGSAIRHIPAAPERVLEVATDPGTWPRWLGLATATSSVPLDQVGRRAPGELRVGPRVVRPVTWVVADRRRDIVRLEAVDERGGLVGRITIGCGRWYDHCATELSVDIPGRRGWGRWMTAASLRRALGRLARSVETPAAARARRPVRRATARAVGPSSVAHRP